MNFYFQNATVALYYNDAITCGKIIVSPQEILKKETKWCQNINTVLPCNHCNDGSHLSWQQSTEHQATQGHLYTHICAGHLHYPLWVWLQFGWKLFDWRRGRVLIVVKKKARFSPRPWPVCLRTRLSILMNWNRESDSFIASFMLLKAVFPEQWKSERRWFQKVSRSRPQDQRSNLVSIFKSRKMSLDSKLYQRGYVCWLASPVKFCWWIVWLC